MHDSKRLSKERYTQHASGYVTSQTHAKGAELARLLELAQPQAHWQMLDIATGGGHTALTFAPHVASVIASDLTPTMLEKAEAHIRAQGITNVTFRVADAENLPFAHGQFDFVTCRIAPHHFPNIAQFVGEAARVLKPDGLLLVQDHVLPEDEATGAIINHFEQVRDPSHNQVLTQSQWEQTFPAAGLHVEHTEEIIKRHNFLDWAARQGCDAATIASLLAIVNTAEAAVRAWMQPEAWTTDEATFVNHHLIIAGRKRNVAETDA